MQFDGPVLELMTASRVRFDQRIAGLGPDILAPELDEGRFLSRLRADDPTRPIGDALLDQRTIAGIGNLWKCEGCFDAAIDPWRPTGDVSDDEALRVVRLTRPRMQQSAREGYQVRGPAIYGHVGRPCPRCGDEDPRARAGRRQPHDILVPGMPALKRIGHKGADLIAPGNTLASFDAALAAGVDMVEFDVLPENPDRSGRLVLAHDFAAAARGEPLTLEEGLAHFAQDAWEGIELDVDLKTHGLRAPRHRRAARVRAGRARAHLDHGGGESAHRPRGGARHPPRLVGAQAAAQLPGQPVHELPALLAAQYARTVLPGRAARAISDGRVDAIMSHWALVTPRLARSDRAGGRRALRVDGRRPDADRQARRDRRHRGHHERPAAVRYRVISHDERDTRR